MQNIMALYLNGTFSQRVLTMKYSQSENDWTFYKLRTMPLIQIFLYSSKFSNK